MGSRHPRHRSLASLPDGVLLMVAMHVASSSPKSFADIGNLKLSCSTFRQVTSDRMVERCIVVDLEYDRMTWGGLERKERYIAFVRRYSDAGNSEANCILGVGVLLLNAVLTVRDHQANSHAKKGWEPFTDAVIRSISQKRRGVVFLLWGNFAQEKSRLIDDSKHYILKAAHPSGLSANRGFFGCRHFSRTNEILEKMGLPPIDWQL